MASLYKIRCHVEDILRTMTESSTYGDYFHHFSEIHQKVSVLSSKRIVVVETYILLIGVVTCNKENLWKTRDTLQAFSKILSQR